MNTWYLSHITVIQQTLIFLLLALSFQVVLRAGVSSFVSIGFFGVGAYTAGNLAIHGFSAPVILLVVVVTSAIAGALMARPLVRLQGLYLGMVTFALNQIVVIMASNGGDITGGAIGLFGLPLMFSTGALAAIALITVVLLSQLERGALRRAFDAIRYDNNVALAMGLETNKLRRFVIMLSAVLGAVSGCLSALTFSLITPETYGFGLLILALTMAVIGGVTSWSGSLIGVIVVTWFPIVFPFLEGGLRQIFYGALVVLVMALEPDGVLGFIQRQRLRIATRRRTAAVADPAVGAFAERPGDEEVVR